MPQQPLGATLWRAHGTQQLGYQGIELHPGIEPYPAWDDAAAQTALRAKYAAYGLQIMGIQCAPDAGDPVSEDPAERAAYAQALCRQIDLVVGLGGQVAGVWPAGRRPDLTDDEIITRLTDVFRQAAPHAEQCGVKVVMEPEPVQVDYTYQIAEAVAKGVGSPNFGILYDVTHANVISSGNPIGLLRRIGPLVGHVHFADNDGQVLALAGASHSSKHLAAALRLRSGRPRAAPEGDPEPRRRAGEGNVDLRGVLAALRDVTYVGWLQIDLWENPDPLQCSRANKAFVDAIYREWAAAD